MLKSTKRSNQKRTAPYERNVYRFARSSVVADRNIKKGEKIQENDIWARRPGNGEIPDTITAKYLVK